MSEQIKDGGPAFPRLLSTLEHEGDQMHSGAPGMTLRDYFAAKAMQGFCANGPENFEDMEQVAEQSYELADYMLSQRGRQS